MNNFRHEDRRLESWAMTVAECGPDALGSTLLHHIAAAAVAGGGSGVLADVLVDTAQPLVARQRAFGLLTAHIRTRVVPQPVPPSPRPAPAEETVDVPAWAGSAATG